MNVLIETDRCVSLNKDLFKIPKIVYVSSFTEESAKQFSSDINDALNSDQEIIPVVIDSFGGQVYALTSMIDTIQSANKTIATIAKGKAMSCGAFLLSFGAKGYRYVSKNATIMIHDISGFCWGKIEEAKADAKEMERLQKLMFSLLDQNCGRSPGYFEKEIHDHHHADWYLTPEECLKCGLVDKIGSPTYKVEAKLNVEWVD